MKLFSRIAMVFLALSLVVFALFATAKLKITSSAQASTTLSAAASQPLLASSQATTPTVTAVGRVELVSTRPIVLQVGGMADQVQVKVGDAVKKGDLLLNLATADLEDALRQAQIGLEQAELGLQAIKETVDASTIAAAEAGLLVAKENLALVEAGPTKEELEAAKSSAAAAWSSYNALRAGPTPEELEQASASLKLAELSVQEAQRAYDEIKWRGDAGMTPQSAELQRATISYQSAKAGYAQLAKGATAAQLQSATAGAQSAQNALNQLQKRPTPADLAAAKAAVASAESALAKLKTGSKAGEIRSAELAVEQAKMGVANATLNLADAKVSAPIDGVVLEVNAQVGQALGAGSTVFVVADISDLQVSVNVEQRDLPLIKVGQKAEVSVYGFSDKLFAGTVERVEPVAGQSSSGPITFPVIIKFDEKAPSALLPGMAATANFVAGK